MNYIKSFVIFAVLLLLPTHLLAFSQNDAKSFVASMGHEAIKTLTDGELPDSEIKSRFRSILERNFSVPDIARFVMGAHWRKLTDEQHTRFREIFAKRLENAYAARFREYKGVTFKVKEGRTEGDGGYVINSTIQKPGGPIINVDWKIYSVSGQAKIFDVTVDGVSMSITLRSDYAAAFQKNGGDAERFLSDIQKVG